MITVRRGMTYEKTSNLRNTRLLRYDILQEQLSNHLTFIFNCAIAMASNYEDSWNYN